MLLVNKEGYARNYINLPDENGNISTYISYICNQSCISGYNYSETHYISYKCTNNSDCLYNKCVNNFCTFDNESSIEYCNNIYKLFLYIEYSCIYYVKVPDDAHKIKIKNVHLKNVKIYFTKFLKHMTYIKLE
ncbi:hypothetical protein H8356DRAFT_1370592 [Neocallimastix lanati (nom. inval.)]|nr:hypothetical protein H8356DRAFT_1370592 [Neocallimastix sp. JGI-2020a]